MHPAPEIARSLNLRPQGLNSLIRDFWTFFFFPTLFLLDVYVCSILFYSASKPQTSFSFLSKGMFSLGVGYTARARFMF